MFPETSHSRRHHLPHISHQDPKIKKACWILVFNVSLICVRIYGLLKSKSHTNTSCWFIKCHVFQLFSRNTCDYFSFIYYFRFEHFHIFLLLLLLLLFFVLMSYFVFFVALPPLGISRRSVTVLFTNHSLTPQDAGALMSPSGC